MDEWPGSDTGRAPAPVRGSFLLERVYADSARDLGIPPQQGVLLCVLTPGPVELSRLGAVLRVAEPTLTGLVQAAETSRHVTRGPDPAGTYPVVLTLTSIGASIAQEFYDETCARIDALTYGLSTSERTALAALLGRFMVGRHRPRPVTHLHAGTRSGSGPRPRNNPTPPAQSA
ncbi:MarR family winged helix-turn-helix transcriptional regulator [Kineosporia sp. NBRC 101731]|uniref:MarR family winged helix-turn-helix transcriptional regulator n=1 Tax=Kineosporia sp. NBRC 101731 TaxID=3032199 RepID=UPI0024A21440|nr:MarR family winged helix-turn-helix transcriptional regulator [Kineosporia sp. NBRC 101731]GLY29629.1 hypothetical protein Kisp02_29940 [Kineosporia sp. NBRC 101731]